MRKLVKNGIYKHFKGDLFIVLDEAKNCEDGTTVVVYRALYGDHQLFVREKEMFLSEVDHDKYPDVKQKYRFEEQKIKSVR